MKFWNIIETVPEAAAAKSWQQRLDGPSSDRIHVRFDSATQVGLLKTGRSVDHLPCEKCGCDHRVQGLGDQLAGICECGKGCEAMRLSAADMIEWQLNIRFLGKAVARALGFPPIIENMRLSRTIQIALHGADCLPIILTIQPDREGFSKLVCQLAARLAGGFILLAPTKRFADDGSLRLLEQANAKFFDLESNLLGILSNGNFRVRMRGEDLFSSWSRPTSEPASRVEARQLEQAVSDIHRDLATARAENRDGFKKTAQSLDAVAQGNYVLRNENDELRRLQSEGYFKFAEKVDAADFQAFAVIMALGNRKAAAEHLGIPHRSFYDRVDKWADQGKEYQRMSRFIEWRKRSGRHIKVRLDESLQSAESGGKPENPETVTEILDTLKTSDGMNYPDLLAAILKALQAQNSTNWPKVRDGLVNLIQEELPQ